MSWSRCEDLVFTALHIRLKLVEDAGTRGYFMSWSRYGDLAFTMWQIRRYPMVLTGASIKRWLVIVKVLFISSLKRALIKSSVLTSLVRFSRSSLKKDRSYMPRHHHRENNSTFNRRLINHG